MAQINRVDRDGNALCCSCMGARAVLGGAGMCRSCAELTVFPVVSMQLRRCVSRDAIGQEMFASGLLRLLGDSLIGCTVWTQAVGNYPGGNALVTEIQPDPAAPEIVFGVEHPTLGYMGIFEWEQVKLIALLNTETQQKTQVDKDAIDRAVDID